MKKTLVEILDELTTRKDLSSQFKRIDEKSLARLQQYFELGFIMISAYRSCEAEKGNKCSEEESLEQIKRNKNNESQMKLDIRQTGFGYIPTIGGYEENVENPDGTKTKKVVREPSFIIPAKKWDSNKIDENDYKKLIPLGSSLSSKYNQDSFFYKPPNRIDGSNGYFIDKDGNTVDKFSNITYNDMNKIYFTFFKKGNETNKRFSFTENDIEMYATKPPRDLQQIHGRIGELFLWENDDTL